MSVGDTNLTNLVLSGDLTVGGALAVTGDLTIEGSGMITVTETFAFDDFADVTTTGTAEFSVDIPVGAYFLCAQVLDIVGFTGSGATATMTIGDGTVVDRYMTGTPSVFTTAAGTVDFGKPSGAPYHGVAKTPTLIVTVADYTAVTAGSVTVALSYIL